MTTPASGLLFANLTRAQDRTSRRTTERNHNQAERLQREAAADTYANPPPF